MKALAYKLFILYACVFSIEIAAQDMIRDSVSGEVFPKSVVVECNGTTYTLQATGSTTRKKFFVQVYSVAHYLQNEALNSPAEKLQNIMSEQYAKQLSMKWLRDVDAAKVQATYQEAFEKIFSKQMNIRLRDKINNFLQFFKAGANKGDEFTIRWFPSCCVDVLINQKPVGSIMDMQFAQGLWSIWFGEDSVVNRDELMR